MKRRFALILIVLMLLTLTACQKSPYTLLEIPDLERAPIGDQRDPLPAWVEEADWQHKLWAYTLPAKDRTDYDRTAKEFFSDLDFHQPQHPERMYLGQGTCLESLDADRGEAVFRMAYPIVYNGVIIGWIITFYLDEFQAQGSTNFVDELNFILENDLATQTTPFRVGYNRGHTIFVVGHSVYDIFQIPNADEEIDFRSIPDPPENYELVNILAPLE